MARSSATTARSPRARRGSGTAATAAPASGAARALDRYNAKRDFRRTAEPPGTAAAVRPEARALAFVVQKHAASHLHFDLRLEAGGTMRSWAVPKGPSLDPSVRRLAMQVEDHPMSYNSFEGTIPKGEYGGGTVMLWDHGEYTPDERAPDESADSAVRRALREGKLAFTVHGERLHGSYALVRTRDDERPQWLLIKHRDEKADTSRDIVAEVKTSVASGRTMEEIAAGAGAAGSDAATAGAKRSGTSVARTKAGTDKTGRSSVASGASASTSTKSRAPKPNKSKPSSASRRTKQATPVPRATKAMRAAIRRDVARAERLVPDDAGDAEPRIGRHTVSLTNLQKVFFPQTDATKGDLLRYYATVGRTLLPHISGRPMVMKRYPNGAEGKHFFMKRAPSHAPEWLELCPVEHASGSVIDFPVVDDLAGLLWLVNLGCIDLNPWYSRCDDVHRPDFLHFDLDPGEGADLEQVREVALHLRALLDDVGYRAYAKTSGSKGLHVYMPIARGPVQKEVWAVAKAMAREMESRHPKLVTAEYRIARRPHGRVLVDYNQNAWGRTLASVYSVRPRPEACVSAPVTWQEVEAGFAMTDFTMVTMPQRLATVGDLWKPMAATRGRATLEALL